MNHLPEDMENALTGSQSSHASLRNIHSINPTQLMARIESYEGREKKGISDVRRTFCLFVTFDLLFVTLLWIIELNIKWKDVYSSPFEDTKVCAITGGQGSRGLPRPKTVESDQKVRESWIKVNGGIENTLEKEVMQYDYYSSYFDIFLLAVFRFKVLILAYAVCRLRHWWAIADPKKLKKNRTARNHF
ncbi:PREDICTED: MLN64 N-terminal domain homolog isoform X5 [Cercocebus atys]|uniref:MLN64 N-terminal domain homolog isoform X5 n=1 Tax=Cercocebus atys TaxID=9531 RepID=UPI0005F54BE1|nr:PREDICTED: MLN64 N-terminal domain homolog isoform X5 [Cercocebus atys]